MLSVNAHSFVHGVHPEELKEQTVGLRVERLPFGDRYILPLRQHAGAPSEPVVEVGAEVQRGQVLARPGGFVSTTLHSPVTGRVVAIGPRQHPGGQIVPALELAADPFATQRFAERPPLDWSAMTMDTFVDHVQQAGLVGLGGAAFPTHVKYRLPDGRRCERLVINGCECEPYLTCDHRLMVERPDAVIRGVEIVGAMLGVRTSTIGVEFNKPDAIDALRAALGGRENIEVTGLAVKYPQGAEKMLIKALFGQEVPAGKLPLDLGMIVNNVQTMAGIADYFDRGKPLIERTVTVAGPGIERPANLVVPIGTSVRAVLQHCGLRKETRQVVMGGPMMGQALTTLDVPVLKGTSGLLAFTEKAIRHDVEYACVRCGNCLEACSNLLNPQKLARLARNGKLDELEEACVNDCMECGACTYACPSGVPIVHLIRTAKATLRRRKETGS